MGKIKNIALYARKSKYTGKGDSIENQIRKCREYVDLHMDDGEKIRIWEYRDEGESGGSMERPMMKQLLQDIEEGRIQLLVCYRLDRISRSVRDFAEFIIRLTELGVEFVSVNEAFDTQTPMGRAMMYISSVFAQLERETIAERIGDNMQALAKTGRWLGGNTPLGFASEGIKEQEEGRQRSYFRLRVVEEEAELVRLIYDQYLYLGSLTRLEQYLRERGFTGRKGSPYSRYALRMILSNPVYCVADRESYCYLTEHSYGVYAGEELFDGIHGLTAYNKSNSKAGKQRVKDVQEWIVSVGEHKGMIPGEQWVRVQRQLQSNSAASWRRPRTVNALFSGILRCGQCGAYMRPKGGRQGKDGQYHYYYQCEGKEKSHRKSCQIQNLQGNLLDQRVVEMILGLRERLLPRHGYLRESIMEIKAADIMPCPGEKLAEKQLQMTERQMGTLLDALGQSREPETWKRILQRMDELNQQQARIRNQLQQMGEKQEERRAGQDDKWNGAALAAGLLHLDKACWDSIPGEEQRELIRMVIKEIIWDGACVRVYLRP